MIQARINRTLAAVILTAAFVALVPACGGGSSSSSNGGLGQPHSLSLVNFLQSGIDNAPLNTVLEFTFSEPLDPATVTSGSLQIRRGPDYGQSAPGEYIVTGNRVQFYPVLPSLCDLSDAGFRPGTSYRISIVGYPEEFCIKNLAGQPLNVTSTHEFVTLPETDPGVLQDEQPAVGPSIISSTPALNSAAVTVEQGNEIVVGFSENLDPCSVTPASVRFHVYETGDPDTFEAAPDGNTTGFVPATKQGTDPYSWGAENDIVTYNPPQVIPAEIMLYQTIDATELRVRPTFGEFPENAFVVLDLTFEIRDFGGLPLTSTSLSFTTENVAGQDGSLAVEFDESTPIDTAVSTADVNTARAPSRAQAFLLFAGDGDNGGLTLPENQIPAFPDIDYLPDDCQWRPSSGSKTVFNPQDDVLLDTGSSRNPCANQTDGSYGVVWEFSSFRIPSGVTVTIAGANPALLLVQGDVIIENGGRLIVRGNAGTNATAYSSPNYNNPVVGKGGKGVAGSGDGGTAVANSTGSGGEGKDGWAGYGSPDYDTPAEEGGVGAGESAPGGQGSTYSNMGVAKAGGGGGHSTEGTQGDQNSGPGVTYYGQKDGSGGGTYPDSSQAYKMYTPSCGSGGGSGGSYMGPYVYNYYEGNGGGGGAGGGFVDITAGGSIYVYGEILGMGGRGGSGSSGYGYYGGGGGGGGGSGGGIRLLTPNDIDLTGGTISVAGGAGGSSGKGTYTAPPPNNGGAGGLGRLVFEDSDSILTGFIEASVTPTEGEEGFYRGTFDASRFQGGGLNPTAVTGVMLVGPICPPTFYVPQASDFVVGIPTTGTRGVGSTAMLVEVQGYPLRADGTPDTSAGTGWYTAGHFIQGVAGPQWILGNPTNPDPDFIVPPSDNLGAGMNNLDGYGYIQLRVSFYLPSGITATEPGPWMDSWDIRFNYDQ